MFFRTHLTSLCCFWLGNIFSQSFKQGMHDSRFYHSADNYNINLFLLPGKIWCSLLTASYISEELFYNFWLKFYLLNFWVFFWSYLLIVKLKDLSLLYLILEGFSQFIAFMFSYKNPLFLF